MDLPPGQTGDPPAIELAAALERLSRLFRKLSPPDEHSLTAMATLATLDRSDPCRLTELAAREGVSQPGMTQLISRLEVAGLVTRATDPKDGRVVLVHITDAGREVVVHRRSLRAERLTELLVQLSAAERAALTAALPAIDALIRLDPEDRQTP